MALNDTNYFEAFATDSGKESTSCHKQQIVIADNSVNSDTKDLAS